MTSRARRRVTPSKSVWILALAVCLHPKISWGLSELFEQYTPPQALSMGNAFTADAYGYLSNYYNPAGLAKAAKKKWEFNAIALEGLLSFGALGSILSSRSLGAYQISRDLQSNPDRYAFTSFSAIPSLATRGFGLTGLANYRVAAVSDGTTVDIDSVFDLSPTIGVAMNFASNLIKVGLTGKAILRNQIKGQFAHSDLSSADAMAALATEGLGFGADLGFMLTIPLRYVPSLGIVWKDVMNTRFSPINVISSAASGAPDPIQQRVHVGLSFRPSFGRRLKPLFTAEMKSVNRSDIPLLKRLHFGIQLETDRSLYFWFGMNQTLFPTLGMALRLPGGNLELGTYAQDIGEGDELSANRRVMFRYTIGF